MVVVQDTREKQGKKDHILNYFERDGISVVRSKLFVGDYTRLDKQDVCIDVKQGLNEVYSNLVQQHVRFRDECLRARQNGIALIVLVEEDGIETLDDVEKWKNFRRQKWLDLNQQHIAGKKLYIKQPNQPPLSSRDLMLRMRTMQDKYGVVWMFTDKRYCGKRIYEILNGYYDDKGLVNMSDLNADCGARIVEILGGDLKCQLEN